MTFPTYEEWCEKVAEQAIDGYIINGRTIREWIEILSDELTMLDKIRAEITENIETYRMSDWETNNVLADGLQMALNIIDGYREGEQE